MCYVGVRPEGPMRVQVGTQRVPLVWFCTGLGLRESELLCPVDLLRLFHVDIGLRICVPFVSCLLWRITLGVTLVGLLW